MDKQCLIRDHFNHGSIFRCLRFACQIFALRVAYISLSRLYFYYGDKATSVNCILVLFFYFVQPFMLRSNNVTSNLSLVLRVLRKQLEPCFNIMASEQVKPNSN